MTSYSMKVTRGGQYVNVDVEFDIAGSRWKVRTAPTGCAWPSRHHRPGSKSLALVGERMDDIVGQGATIEEAMRDYVARLLEWTS
jgi:hypothetical protein